MRSSRRIVATLAAALGLATLAGSPAPAEPERDRWQWLAGSYWYVPSQYLPAVRWDTSNPSAYSGLSDQTVWYIQSYDEGYFAGSVAVQFGGYSRTCQYLIGSVTPEGDVLISFTPLQAIPATDPTVTSGTGRMVRKQGRWAFSMQMSSGSGSTQVTHWAYMMRCKPSQPCWTNLPATSQSLGDFIAGCS